MDPMSANQGLISHACLRLGTGNYVPDLAEEQEESLVLRGMSAGSQEPLWSQAGGTLGSPLPSSFSRRLLQLSAEVTTCLSFTGGAPPINMI